LLCLSWDSNGNSLMAVARPWPKKLCFLGACNESTFLSCRQVESLSLSK